MDNCRALCRTCHSYFTTHPAEWYWWLRQRMGVRLDDLERRANDRWPGDYPEVLRALTEELARVRGRR